MFPIIDTVLAEDHGFQGLHGVSMVGEVRETHLGQKVLGEVESCDSSKWRDYLQHCFVTQLIPYELHCSHSCPSQKLTDLQDCRVSQFGIGQIQSLQRVVIEGFEDLLKFLRELDGLKLLLGGPLYLLDSRLLEVHRLPQFLTSFIPNLHFGFRL
jgi:hypothetical protein